MKKILSFTGFALCLGMALAQDGFAKGGVTPGMASCCLGPRIGLEMNEGIPIRTEEWINAFIFPIVPFEAYDKVGFKGCLASCFLGPRVGMQLKERKIRTKEWVTLIPVVGLIPRAMIAIEAGQGKTMTEIEAKEGLKK